MHNRPSRRNFLASLGGMITSLPFCRCHAFASPLPAASSRFKLSVITDEITQDFGHALEIAAREFGLTHVELRTLWNKNIINLDEKETADVRGLLKKYE